MAEEKPTDDVEKVLSDLKTIEDRKQALIADLLRQKAAAVKAFDDRLAKLGYSAKDGAGKPKKSHHKAAATAAGKQAKTKVPATDGPGKLNAPTVPRRRR
jgi:hypothetical protein